MNREDIIKLAREADLLVLAQIPDDSVFVADLERFAALVAAAEREACAKVCEMGQHIEYDGHADCAAAIRARSNT